MNLTPEQIKQAAAVALARQREYEAGYSARGLSLLERPVEYIDPAPKPFEVQIPLWEYFERIKRHRADRWQKDFCGRLQDAYINRHVARLWALIHAEAQLGKSSILAQTLSAWILGHQPLHRVALATYNVTRSQSHSKVVIGIMNLPVHKEIFPDPAGWVDPKTTKEGWMTPARRELNDGQLSFNPVGLQSGLTGSGFDTLIIDDPYADQKEAFSETVRATLQDFWDYTVMSRMGTYSNVFGMFHRYHIQDLAGYLLDKGSFDYWRYATVCDGDYVHTETGRRYPDPLKRELGEYISPERRPPSYYVENRKNKRVWSSMFQGKPTSDEGDFFNVNKITVLPPAAAEERKAECIAMVRAWDNAATEGGGDWTVGTLGGIRHDGRITVFEAELAQVGPEGRQDLIKKTAERDGPETIIRIPQDPGSAGKFEAWATQQMLKDYTVVARVVSGTKEMRALNYADNVNSGRVDFVSDELLPPEKVWVTKVKNSMRDFPLSEFDDPVDSGADMNNTLYEIYRRGTVIKNYRPQRSLLPAPAFAARFPVSSSAPADAGGFKAPANFTVYAGVKVSADASLPSGFAVVARAPANSNLDETLFVLAEYKAYDGDVNGLFENLGRALERVCETPKAAGVWLHPDSAHFAQTVRQKLGVGCQTFGGGEVDGLVELDWYLAPVAGKTSPFAEGEEATRLYLVVDPFEYDAPVSDLGLVDCRREFRTWGYTEKGTPSPSACVADCLRMVARGFRTHAAPLTFNEKVERNLAPEHRSEYIGQVQDPTEKMNLMNARRVQEGHIRRQLKEKGFSRNPLAKLRRK